LARGGAGRIAKQISKKRAAGWEGRSTRTVDRTFRRSEQNALLKSAGLPAKYKNIPPRIQRIDDLRFKSPTSNDVHELTEFVNNRGRVLAAIGRGVRKVTDRMRGIVPAKAIPNAKAPLGSSANPVTAQIVKKPGLGRRLGAKAGGAIGDAVGRGVKAGAKRTGKAALGVAKRPSVIAAGTAAGAGGYMIGRKKRQQVNNLSATTKKRMKQVGGFGAGLGAASYGTAKGALIGGKLGAIGGPIGMGVGGFVGGVAGGAAGAWGAHKAAKKVAGKHAAQGAGVGGLVGSIAGPRGIAKGVVGGARGLARGGARLMGRGGAQAAPAVASPVAQKLTKMGVAKGVGKFGAQTAAGVGVYEGTNRGLDAASGAMTRKRPRPVRNAWTEEARKKSAETRKRKAMMEQGGSSHHYSTMRTPVAAIAVGTSVGVGSRIGSEGILKGINKSTGAISSLKKRAVASFAKPETIVRVGADQFAKLKPGMGRRAVDTLKRLKSSPQVGRRVVDLLKRIRFR
jgi:hypothetical protein